MEREDAGAVAVTVTGVASKNSQSADMPIKARSYTAVHAHPIAPTSAEYVCVTKEEVEDTVKRAVSDLFQKIRKCSYS